jgi:short-subunit dehydrogenase involved in D-alanine esterification of teichoic acids
MGKNGCPNSHHCSHELNQIYGIASHVGPLLTTHLATARTHLEVNVSTLGPLALCLAAYPFMRETTSIPTFVPISSGSGSIEAIQRYPRGPAAYNASKAALNSLTRSLRYEHDDLSVLHSLHKLRGAVVDIVNSLFPCLPWLHPTR